MRYKKGDKIFSSGDEANKLYIVCTGKTKVTKYTQDGKEQIIYILTSGDFIGAFNLLKKDKFDFDMIALKDTTISALEKDAFDRLILLNPSITLKVLEKAYERIMKVERLAERLALTSLDQRVASMLLNFADEIGKPTEQGIVLELSMNQEELGAYAGITRETISRKLNLFQENQWIELVGTKKVIVKDVNALRNAFN
ncbi:MULTISPECIES: Crp/Fnr family transcriptional regulator [unclassified Fusibacter]|uniref:Crp/Fnr family transcriptional regulator n=1 Tax=unclassified Fusibacter TaxID=2624464 RepID=UPI001011E984|nr:MULTISPECIES: Crp/Fnr family transcriptional regulator [unclassified Fusibacter]MCK8061101.1 Crp/Fnr family transcriptional regulator [Fusibacter sp. A2]NPE23363.1 Crp/Fnr family transcriptional regulator [Fusibacter sp. A1]RXV59408.1 Crp/Fnr family transcriptional regulator [Fusibacter sp. A1]